MEFEKLDWEKDIKGKMSPCDVIKYYFPDMPPDEVLFLLWEKTCFPMDTETFLNQVYEIYDDKVRNLGIKGG